MTTDKLAQSARTLFTKVGEAVNTKISVKLWDGSVVPLGDDADPNMCLSISGPGVIGSLMRRPTLDNFIRHYAQAHIDFHGADFMTFMENTRVKKSRERARNISKFAIGKSLLPFLFVGADRIVDQNDFQGDETGRNRVQDDNKDYIRFHYDISNDFYRLFLDKNMVYTCAYFTDWNNSIDQAQFDKLDMICRKLQLKPGEKLLDIGCGWGALVCHAVEHYGVIAHGVTLSQAQVDFACDKIRALGLEGRASVEYQDYSKVEGHYDKVAAIGIIEHVGIANIPKYLRKVKSLLPDRGIFLNHGITRTAKHSNRKFRKIRSEQRMLAKYIFPGGELDHIGHTLEKMEATGFRVQDVEGWRDHYALTCKLWCNRLWENREEAIELVGREKFRLWLAYLGCVSYALGDGTACLFQTVVTKHKAKGLSGMPPTREHLYDRDDRMSAAA